MDVFCWRDDRCRSSNHRKPWAGLFGVGCSISNADSRSPDGHADACAHGNADQYAVTHQYANEYPHSHGDSGYTDSHADVHENANQNQHADEYLYTGNSHCDGLADGDVYADENQHAAAGDHADDNTNLHADVHAHADDEPLLHADVHTHAKADVNHFQ